MQVPIRCMMGRGGTCVTHSLLEYLDRAPLRAVAAE